NVLGGWNTGIARSIHSVKSAGIRSMEAASRAHNGSDSCRGETKLEVRDLPRPHDDAHDVPVAWHAGSVSGLLEINARRKRKNGFVYRDLVQRRGGNWNVNIRSALGDAWAPAKHDLSDGGICHAGRRARRLGSNSSAFERAFTRSDARIVAGTRLSTWNIDCGPGEFD